MRSLLSSTLPGLYFVCLAVKFGCSAGALDFTNAFESFKYFPRGIAIFDEDEDGDLDCLRAKLTKFQNDSATYVWFVKGDPPKRIAVDIQPGPTPDVVVYEMDNDKGHEHKAYFFYIDYNCMLHDFYHNGNRECVMWVQPDIAENLPQICTDKYLEYCNTQKIVYDKDSCSEFMDFD
uniref:Putative lipocalin-5 1 n=1 Tax=Amblyomma triste TaxID=251400 RepID=A0A023GA10_AMBTT